MTTSNSTNMPGADTTPVYGRFVNVLEDEEASSTETTEAAIMLTALTGGGRTSVSSKGCHDSSAERDSRQISPTLWGYQNQRATASRLSVKASAIREKCSAEPMGAIPDTKPLHLLPVFHHHVQEHGADPGLFFTDNGSLRRTITDSGDESDAFGDAFVSRQVHDRIGGSTHHRQLALVIHYADVLRPC